MKPFVYASPSRWPGVWVWNVTTEEGQRSNWFEWRNAIRAALRFCREGAD